MQTAGKLRILAIAAVLALLSSCGGGSDAPAPAPPANRAPVAQAVSLSTNEDTALSATFAASDPDGDALVYSVATAPGHGAVTLSGAIFTYTPGANYSGTDTFTVAVSDGRGGTASAAVNVTIAEVNDAPALASVAGPAQAFARQVATFTATASDVDGPTPVLTVEQLSGTAVQVSVQGLTASISFANVAAVETARLRFVVRDAGGLQDAREVQIPTYPVSANGRLRTVRGSPSARSLHLVITGDGYTASEQDRLWADAIAVAGTLVDSPDVIAYRGAWSVHILDQASNESGVDIPSQTIVRDTAFDGTLDCLGTARLLCVDQGKVLNTVVQEFPAYTQVLVISNTDVYGGSGGVVSVASRNQFSKLIALHEIGHSFAGLVDEYLDTVLDTGPIIGFQEALYPNATAVTDPAAVKWRHWFTDPQNIPRAANQPGVGLFEGAVYRATGYYRPTWDSFMRTLSENMGPVNSERWVQSIYARLGAVSAVSPTASSLTTTAGTTTLLSVQPSFGASLQDIRWYVDGVEITAAHGAASYLCCASTSAGTRAVRVIVSDASGLVRDPAANPSRLDRTWQVQFN